MRTDSTGDTKTGFVIYVDALGTSAHQKDIGNRFEKFRKKVEEWFPPDRWPDNIIRLGLSDSLFLVLHTEGKYQKRKPPNMDDVQLLFQSLKEFQFKCLKLGMPLRGGITYGTYTVDKEPNSTTLHMIVGRVIVEAVRMEQSMKMIGIGLVPSFMVEGKFRKRYKRYIEYLQRADCIMKCDIPSQCGVIPSFLVKWADDSAAVDELLKRYEKYSTGSDRKRAREFPVAAKYIATLKATGGWDNEPL